MSNPNPNPANNLVNNPPNPPNPQPNLLPQQLMVAVRATVARMTVAPRCGGLDTVSTVDIAWTGEVIHMMQMLWYQQPMVVIDSLTQTRPGRLKTSVCNHCLRPGSYK